MNMAKLGTVSRAGNYFSTPGNPRKQRAGGMTRYTLCVFKNNNILIIIVFIIHALVWPPMVKCAPQ